MFFLDEESDSGIRFTSMILTPKDVVDKKMGMKRKYALTRGFKNKNIMSEIFTLCVSGYKIKY